jgi:pimeloyl-ACP methyl ester carboxylesterase
MTYEFTLGSLGMWNVQHRDGEGSRILMIPGFWANDQSLYPLAWRLRRAGHRVFFAGLWWNTGCPRDTIEYLDKALRELYLGDRKKLVIIGHSLGGIYARELARRTPDVVDRIVLMGSAIRNPFGSTNPLVFAWYAASRPRHREGGDCLDALATLCGTHQLEPPGVAETIIYSRRDEVVAWRSCLESGPNVECIEINSSHYTMPYLPEVWKIILDRLKAAAATPVALPPPAPPPSRTPVAPKPSHVRPA